MFRFFLLLNLLFSLGCNLPANRHNLDGKRNFQTGQFSQALNSFQTALMHDPSNADSHYNIGRTFHQIGKTSNNSGQIAQAETAYRQAINLNPAHQPSYRALTVLLMEKKRNAEAIALLQNWSRMQPGSAEPKVELARVYSESGDRQSAIQLLGDALAIDFDNDRALRAMGMMREQAGQLPQALENYRRSLEINPMQPELVNRIAQLQTRTISHPAPSQAPSRIANVPSWPKY